MAKAKAKKAGPFSLLLLEDLRIWGLDTVAYDVPSKMILRKRAKLCKVLSFKSISRGG